MQSNADSNKQGQEAYFSKKSNNENSLPVTFNNAKVVTCSTHKHFRLLRDKRLSFSEHTQSKMNKCYNMIRVIKRLSVNLPRDALLSIYKSFIRPHLDYGDIIYDKPHNESFKNKNINDSQVYKTRASEHNNKKRFGTRTENFKQSFFPFFVNE